MASGQARTPALRQDESPTSWSAVTWHRFGKTDLRITPLLGVRWPVTALVQRYYEMNEADLDFTHLLIDLDVPLHQSGDRPPHSKEERVIYEVRFTKAVPGHRTPRRSVIYEVHYSKIVFTGISKPGTTLSTRTSG